MNILESADLTQGQIDRIVATNGQAFIDNLGMVGEVITCPEWSDYYIHVGIKSLLFAAQWCVVKYSILPPNSDRNGANISRMLIKNF